MAFAPGKVILLGEHAVVYGHPALAGALGSGVEVEALPGEGMLHVPAWSVSLRRGDASLSLGLAYTALLEELERKTGAPAPRMDLRARFHLPTGSGLGSSAALSVAIARALGEGAGHPYDAETIFDVAMAAEMVFHGRSSGIDHAVAAHGGFGLYTRASGFAPLKAARSVPLVVGHTGRERDTKSRVARVAELVAEWPADTTARFEAVGALVRAAVAAIDAGDHATLGAAMNENQEHLEALEVSCPEIDALCRLARGAGALGVKLTGGGGGGCVIALGPGREEEIRAAWERAGFHSFVTVVGGVHNREAAAADATTRTA